MDPMKSDFKDFAAISGSSSYKDSCWNDLLRLEQDLHYFSSTPPLATQPADVSIHDLSSGHGGTGLDPSALY